MKEVVIFRHQLFKVSEPFIAQQAQSLRRFRPLYIGRERFGSSPNGAESFVLQDMEGERPFFRRVRQVITRDSHPYLRLLSKRRPALIHAHFGVDGVYALPLAKRLGVPLITTFHGFDATMSTAALLCSGSPSLINYVALRHQLAKHGDIFLCVSKFIRDRVVALGFPENRTHVHYIGIDTQTVQPRAPSEETLTVLHIARLVEVKGTEYLVRAFAKVAGRQPSAKLVVIGEGPLRPALEGLVNSLGLRKQVDFKGAVSHSEVMSWIRKAAVVALTSVTTRAGYVEGLGMVLLEAAAMAVPSVATNHGGIPEIVIDGETGYLVQERDTDRLGESICALLQNKSLRLRMGRAARELVETRFNIRQQTRRLEGVYERVLS